MHWLYKIAWVPLPLIHPKFYQGNSLQMPHKSGLFFINPTGRDTVKFGFTALVFYSLVFFIFYSF